MKFIACVKLTPDTEQLAEVRPEKVGTGDLGVTMVLNPWDEYAVEEALQLAERYDGDTVAITVGTEDSVEALKRAVAMGVGEAVLLCDPAFAGSDAWGTAADPGPGDQSPGRLHADPDRQAVGRRQQRHRGGGRCRQAGHPLRLERHQDRGCQRWQCDRAAHAGRGPADGQGDACRRSSPSASRSTSHATRTSWASARPPACSTRRVGVGDLPGLDTSQVGAGAALVKWTDLRKPPNRGPASASSSRRARRPSRRPSWSTS